MDIPLDNELNLHTMHHFGPFIMCMRYKSEFNELHWCR